MKIFACISALLLGSASAQFDDDFVCPDEFEGFYPHDYSCDKYWECKDGKASLELCGNGLGFADTDPTYTTKNCDYLYSVNCGNRSEVEPPISAPNCPRLYGTFEDPDDCAGFYQCRDGLANRFTCAPGLAYDLDSRVCEWSDQVKRCKELKKENDILEGLGEDGEFVCPNNVPVGIFSKHAHPADCRQYYVCIAGIPREYGCPLGTVFKVGNSEFDGQCSDPEDVPECANYYGDLEFDKNELVRSGADPDAVGAKFTEGRTRVSRPNILRNQPAPRPVVEESQEYEYEEEEEIAPARPSRPQRPSRPAPAVPSRTRTRLPSRPASEPIASIPVSRPEPVPARTNSFTPSRTRFNRPSSNSRLPPSASVPKAAEKPSSLIDNIAVAPSPQAVDIRGLLANAAVESSASTESIPPPPPSIGGFPEFVSLDSAEVIEVKETTKPAVSSSSTAAVASSTEESLGDLGEPSKVKAGEDYYYYYYYYDDEDGEGEASAAASA